jgi:hypothetical protein
MSGKSKRTVNKEETSGLLHHGNRSAAGEPQSAKIGSVLNVQALRRADGKCNVEKSSTCASGANAVEALYEFLA